MRIKQPLLRDLCRIRTGYSTRRKVERINSQGNIELIQPADIAQGNKLMSTVKVANDFFPGSYQQHFLKSPSILITNKGIRFNTCLYKVDAMHPPAIATSGLFIIDNFDGLLPEYLLWYLGQSQALDYLRRSSQATTSIPSLSLSNLSKLTIPLPTLTTQEKIAVLDESVKDEIKLLEELKLARRKWADSFIWEHINKQQS
jgi:hypothetical protein